MKDYQRLYQGYLAHLLEPFCIHDHLPTQFGTMKHGRVRCEWVVEEKHLKSVKSQSWEFCGPCLSMSVPRVSKHDMFMPQNQMIILAMPMP